MTALGSSMMAARRSAEMQGDVARDADLHRLSGGSSRLEWLFLLRHDVASSKALRIRRRREALSQRAEPLTLLLN